MKSKYELRQVGDRGEGIFSTGSFKAGETVMVGKVEKPLGANDSHASQVAKNTFIRHAGMISKVNHSCGPNCGIRVNDTGAHDFVAMREIGANEEITFDYAMRNYTIEHFPPRCMCGSEFCRGQVTGWKDLPAARKKDYKGFVAPYLYELDAETAELAQPIA